MKIFSLALILTTTLSTALPLAAQSPAEPNRVEYQCEKEQSLQVTFFPKSDTYPDGAAEVTFPDGKTLTLPQVISGSGARYSDENTTFWSKGNTAFVEVNDKITINNCVVVQNDGSNSEEISSGGNLQGTKWKLLQWGTESDPKTPLKNTEINAEFTADRINGLGGCNRYHGGYQIKNEELIFTPIAATRRACLPDIMKQEFEYFARLQGAKNYQINDQGQLTISYQTKQETGVMVFEPQSEASQPIKGSSQ